jgi:hypothetical protein
VTDLKWTISLGEQMTATTRWASIQLEGTEVFSELVYDTDLASAETNIKRLFAVRLQRLLEES